MIRKELKNFEDRLQWHNDKYKLPDIWGKIIYKFMKYKDTKVIGSENFTDLRPEYIWIAGAFVDFGRNNYMVRHNQKIHMHETFVEYRREDIPIMLKEEVKAQLKLRNPNVFHDWARVVQEQVNDVAFESDCLYWKINNDRFIKTKSEQLLVAETIKKHYDYLKDVYLTMAVYSNFPYIRMTDFTNFCWNANIIDDKLTKAQVVSDFITAEHKIEG